MPKIEYGYDKDYLLSLKYELSDLKTERANAYIDNDIDKVDFCSARIKEILEEISSIENRNNAQ